MHEVTVLLRSSARALAVYAARTVTLQFQPWSTSRLGLLRSAGRRLGQQRVFAGERHRAPNRGRMQQWLDILMGGIPAPAADPPTPVHNGASGAVVQVEHASGGGDELHRRGRQKWG